MTLLTKYEFLKRLSKLFSIEIHQNKENAVATTGRNHLKDLWVVTVALT